MSIAANKTGSFSFNLIRFIFHKKVSILMIICLMGPTATGKSDLALSLAQKLQGEIVSVDSALVYRSMNVGTAKPSVAQRQCIPHHLIDICDPSEPYSAAQFQEDAYKLVLEIKARGKLPILVGGTMLYFKALQEGLSPLPKSNAWLRDALIQEANVIGWEQMHAKLAQIDPESAQRIDTQDQQRIARALEVYELTGVPMSTHWQVRDLPDSSLKFVNLALIPVDRKQLHSNITRRFDAMLAQGLIAEVEQLFQRGDLDIDLPAMRSVGYRQVWQYLAGSLSLEEMREQAIVATRQLAKRQLTWLRSWQKIVPFNAQSPQLEQEVTEFLVSSTFFCTSKDNLIPTS